MQNRETRINEFLSKISKIVEGRKNEEVKFTEYKSGELTISAESLEVGSDISQVVEGANVPLEDGKYVIEDKEYTVKDSKIESIADVQASEAPIEQEEIENADAPVEKPEEDVKETGDMEQLRKDVDDLMNRVSTLEDVILGLREENSKLKADFSAIPSTITKTVKTINEPSKFDKSLALEHFNKIKNK